LGKKIKVSQVSIEILGKIFLCFSIFGENGQNFRVGSNSKINGRSGGNRNIPKKGEGSLSKSTFNIS
jgi:hypothetical protein